MGIVQYFINRPEFREAIATEAERVLTTWNGRRTHFNQHVEKTVKCMLGKEYDVFSLDTPARVSGLFDLSEMRGGDRVEIVVRSPVAGREEKIVDRWILDNYQEMPVFVMPEIVLAARARISIEQTRGVSIGVGVEIFAFE